MAKRDINRDWIYERKSMQSQFNAIMDYRIPIRDVPDDSSAIAYATDEPAIYIKRDSPLTKGLPDHLKRSVHFGLFAREMCHMQFTDFEHFNEVSGSLEPWEAPAFKMIFDVVEDPAVENCAPSLFGGYLLKALKYAVKRSYEMSPAINEIENPFSQFITAITQFGDMGPVKGHFTDPLAKRTFYRVCTTMSDIITCGDPAQRVDMALDIFEESRPLWEKGMRALYELLSARDSLSDDDEDRMKIDLEDGSDVSLSMDDLMGFLDDLGASIGKSIPSGKGTGCDFDPEEIADMADLSKGAMRKNTFKKLEDMDPEERAAYEKEMAEPEEEVLDEGDDAEKDYESLPGVPYSSDTDTIVYSDKEIDLSTPGDYDPAEYDMSVEGVDFLDRLVQSEIEMDAAKEGGHTPGDVPDFNSIDKKYKLREYKVLNRFPTVSNPEVSEVAYDRIVKKNLKDINKCYKNLSRLFAEESEETVYRSSGRLDIDRYMSSDVTPKLFTKTLDPKDKSNMAVFLLIDESGSMSGSRIERAKEASINLAEIFGKLGIPCYMMGFTGDIGGAQAVHDHFGTWENKKEDRVKLTSIHAQAENFDGYSIRYASSILALRPETHKLLIVVSDGQPACSVYYGNRISGYSDTKDAIREAREEGQYVLGVAIGADVDVLQKMYGTDFIFIDTGDDLFGGIMKKFTAMVKKW